MKSGPTIIRVQMLGGFSLWEQERLIFEDKGKNGKIRNLLAYLVFHRHRTLAPGELSELLCQDEKIEDPVNTVKNLAYRLRKQLETSGLEGSCILQSGGTYHWNPEVKIDLDVEIFQQKCQEAAHEPLHREKAWGLLIEAAELYKGELLPGLSYEEWTISHRAYSHRVYINCIREIAVRATNIKERSIAIGLCEKAIAIDPYEEELYRIYIELLLASDQIHDARNAYETIVDRLYKELGINPTVQLKGLYKKILKRINSVEMDLNNIQQGLQEEGKIQGSFCTEYEVFQDIYRFMSRNVERKGGNSFLQLWTLEHNEEEFRDPDIMREVMEKLKEAIQLGLRKGDIFAQYSVSQYILILQDIVEENVEMVGNRILKLYNSKKGKTGTASWASFKNQEILLKDEGLNSSLERGK